MNAILKPLSFLPLPALLTLSACGGGGGAPPAAPLGNMAVTNVRLVSTDPHAAHQMRLAVTVDTTQPYDNVAVTYVLLDRADVQAELDDVRQHEVSTSVIPAVAAGSAAYEVLVVIPAAAREDGDWYLVPHLDPANAIPEINETDNEPIDDSKVRIAIGNGNTDRADIVLESVDIEQDAVVLLNEPTLGGSLGYGDPRDPTGGTRSANDVQNHDFDATLEATTTGTQAIARLDITATIVVPGEGELALQFWDDDRQQYRNEVFAPVTPGFPTTVNMDVFIPSGTRRRIETHLRAGRTNTFEVIFSSNMTSGIGEWENGNQRHEGRATGTDNRISAELVIVLPPTEQPDPCNPIRFDANYDKTWSNSTFGLGVDFGASASLDERGARGQAHAAVPVKLFGAASNAMDLRTFGRVRPREGQPTDSEFSLDFKMFGFTIYTRTSTDPSIEVVREETFTRTYEVRGRVFAGPVPIQLLARTSGTMGYKLSAYVDTARMELLGQAFGRVDAFASASVNVVIVEAGVAGAITLIDDVFTARATCQLGTPGGGRLTGTLRLEAINELTGPNGRIYVYESHLEPKWCWTVIPCGVRRVRNEKTLARFRSFTKTDVLFERELTQTVCLN